MKEAIPDVTSSASQPQAAAHPGASERHLSWAGDEGGGALAPAFLSGQAGEPGLAPSAMLRNGERGGSARRINLKQKVPPLRGQEPRVTTQKRVGSSI